MEKTEQLDELIKEKFFTDVVHTYHISDTANVYRKEVDESLIYDFYMLWDQCNKLIQEKANVEADIKVDLSKGSDK